MVSAISKTRLYGIYAGMKQRCYNPDNSHYKWYGAKSITICDEWLNDNGLQNFIEWALSNGYNENLTIDRIDSDSGYLPNNCRWVTASENTKNANKNYNIFSTEPLKPGFNYNRLWKLLIDKGMNKTQLREAAKIGTATLSRLNKNEHVSMEVVEKICSVLNCQASDVMEFVEGKEA